MSEDHTGLQSGSANTQALHVLGQPVVRRERADAARNRQRVLAAASLLFANRGVEDVSMDDIAAAATVGKGTLFRRFGDKAGLAAALLDEQERELQAGILSGPPPLGPGAEPAARLVAFITAYLDYALTHLEIVRLSETASPGARYRVGSYRFWHRHAAILIGASQPAADADAMAHVLLAPLAGDLLHGLGADAMPGHRAAVCRTAEAIVNCPTSGQEPERH
jgi:AcrR family transcriptional regulator